MYMAEENESFNPIPQRVMPECLTSNNKPSGELRARRSGLPSLEWTFKGKKWGEKKGDQRWHHATKQKKNEVSQ